MTDDLLRYSVLQVDLQALDPEALLRAFRVVPQLVGLDAASLARDAFGILAEELPRDDAFALQAALRMEGIETEAVPSHKLLRLPQPRNLQKAACTEDAFITYDIADRETRLDWSTLGLIAVGNVVNVEFHISESAMPTGSGAVHMTGGSTRQEKLVPTPTTHLILTVEPGSYKIDAFKFNYSYLKPSPTAGALNNFKALMADMISRAPMALLNRGARIFKYDPTKIMDYPSRHAFEEEMVWMLWKAGSTAT